MGADPVPVGNALDELLLLALSRPNEALERAREVLAGSPRPLDESVARQAVGIVLREFGDIDAAVDELRIARRLARRSNSAEREADLLATLGVTLVFAGRTTAGRNALDAAARQSVGPQNGRSCSAAAAPCCILGRHREALADLNSAITALQLADDPIWEARALTERAFTYLASARYGEPPPTSGAPRGCSPPRGRSWSRPTPPCTAVCSLCGSVTSPRR